MAGTGFFDLTTAATTTLIAKESVAQGNIRTASICNQHASSDIAVDLFYDDGLGNADSDVYIIKNTVIPPGASLFLDNLSFDSFAQNLKITLVGSGLPVSVILK